MGEDVAADGGGTDGSALAEARIVVNGQVLIHFVFTINTCNTLPLS